MKSAAVEVDGDWNREDYYAWEWGDALFVVIDPYHYTMSNPYGAHAREGADDPATGDRWDWSLGLQQFNWLKKTLCHRSFAFLYYFANFLLTLKSN